jgi:hypothetical protein
MSQNELAGAQCGLLEIRRVGRKNLPARHRLARHILPEYVDGSHAGELAPKASVVLLAGGEPDPVVGRLVWLVAEDQDNLVLHVDRKTTEHGSGPEGQRVKRVEDEFMRDGFAAFRGEGRGIRRLEG